MILELDIRLAGELTRWGGLPALEALEQGVVQDAPPVEDFSNFIEALPFTGGGILLCLLFNLGNQTIRHHRNYRELDKVELLFTSVAGALIGTTYGLVKVSR